MNFDEAALLWRTVRNASGDVLEVGRKRAGSTVLISAAAQGRNVISIDIAPDHAPEADEFLRKLAATTQIELLVQDSRQPLSGREFGVAFIDGDHSYEGVHADTLAHWASVVSVGGSPPTIVYHDAVPNKGLAHLKKDNHCKGVSRLCEELISGGYAKHVESAGSALVLEKINELPESF